MAERKRRSTADASAPRAACPGSGTDYVGDDTVGPDTSALARLVGQEAVVEEVRGRLDAISAGAHSGEDAHVCLFYGFRGTGKTYLAELIAHAVHGSTALPHHKKIAVQNDKTDEDMWTLVSPPCGLKGKEGSLQQLFRPRQAQAERKGHSPPNPGPVLVFDEIEGSASGLHDVRPHQSDRPRRLCIDSSPNRTIARRHKCPRAVPSSS